MFFFYIHVNYSNAFPFSCTTMYVYACTTALASISLIFGDTHGFHACTTQMSLETTI